MKRGVSTLPIWALITAVQFTGIQSDNSRRFPESFKFGIGTSSYQIEGGWNASDKGISNWDHSTHTEPWRVSNEENGDTACNSYNQYKRDVEMLRELGVDFYRFSISWARVLPTGFNNYISKDGVDYYNNLINELLKYNIQPVVTIFHFDLPQSLQDLGGWTNPLIVTWFEDYARVLFEQFGDRVKTWITINEPHSLCFDGYGLLKSFSMMPLVPYFEYHGIADYICSQNVLKAHAHTYHMYKDMFRSKQHGRIGISLEIIWTHPATNSTDDVQAKADYFECRTDLFVQPIFGSEGGFPTNCIRSIAAKSQKQGFPRTRLPQLTSGETAFIKGTADFLGVNHYTTLLVYRNSSLEGLLPVPSWLDDINVLYMLNEEWPSAASSWLKVYPQGLREALSYLHKKYDGLEMIITENGISSFGGLQDEDRVDYYRQYLNAVLDAILKDGVNVTGYTAWSLMDNFEWANGYSVQFGLYQVDFEDLGRKRTARKSALVYKEILRSRTIDPNYEPTSINITIS